LFASAKGQGTAIYCRFPVERQRDAESNLQVPKRIGGATRAHKTTTSRVPYDVDAKCQVNMPKFSRIPDSNENSAYFLHVFQENAQLVKFFANLEEKRIPFHSRKKGIKNKKTPLVRGNKNSEFKNTNIFLIKLN
jgi:hypothetical protein